MRPSCGMRRLTRHDLDAGADCGIALDGKLRAVLQIAVDAVAHLDFLFKGLDVNIRRTEGDRLLDDGVHQPHGGVVDDVVLPHDEVELRVAHRLREHLVVLRLLQIVQRLGGGEHRHDRVDIDVDLRGRNQHKIQLSRKGSGDHRTRVEVERAADRKKQHPLLVDGDGDELVFLHEREGKTVHQLAVYLEHVHFHVGKPVKFAQRGKRGGFRAISLDEHVGLRRHMEAGAFLQDFVPLAALDDFFIDKVLQYFVI